MSLLPGLSNVIGRPATIDGLRFVPVVGSYEYVKPRLLLQDHADLTFLDSLNDDDPPPEALWVRGRLIRLFGINHPAGNASTTLLDFQVVAVMWEKPEAPPELLEPVLVSDNWDGDVGEYGYDGEVGLAFRRHVPKDMRARIATAFWSLLLANPFDLGVFCDYWFTADGESIERVRCNGTRIEIDTVAWNDLSPCDDDDPAAGWWPFELPRKRKQYRRPRR